jgi:hypothetical protein
MGNVRANYDDSIYNFGLVVTSPKNAQLESIRGRDPFNLGGNKHKFYIWKRTYHWLSGLESRA